MGAPAKWFRKIRVIQALPQRGRFTEIGQMPLSIKPTRDVGPRPIALRDDHVFLRRGLTHGLPRREAQEARAVPETAKLRGSLEERIVYKELLKRRIRFDFQSSKFGGRRFLGGLVADFILPDHDIIILPQGTIWHGSIAGRAQFREQKGRYREVGYEVLEVWDWELMDERLTDAWFKRHLSHKAKMRRNVPRAAHYLGVVLQAEIIRKSQ